MTILTLILIVSCTILSLLALCFMILFAYLLLVQKITGTPIKNLLFSPDEKVKKDPKSQVKLTKNEKLLTIVLSFLINPISIWFLGFYYYKGLGYLKKASEIRIITLLVLLLEILFVIVFFLLGQIINN